MDLGIAGKHAIVCASSKGLGRACAESLAREGANVTINGRDAVRLEATAAEIRDAHSVTVQVVVGDIEADETRSALLEACPRPDILVNNNGGPAPGRYQDWDRDAWVRALDANMISPALMIRDVLDGMVERQFGRIINITSAMVKMPLAPMGLSTGARAGLTALSKSLSRRVVKNNVTINNLLPERIDSPRQVYMAELQAKNENISYEEARERIVGNLAAKRMGLTEEFGAACAFLCSTKSGYISGQNLQLDGGTYPGVI